MTQLTLIVKPTHACNLHCPYCYDKVNRNDPHVMTLETVQKLLDVCGDATYTWTWHGGEPLLMPLDFFYTANDLISQKPRIRIAMQTNGTLITESIIEMFKKYGIRPGLSFDGIRNEFTRKSTGKLMKNKNLMDKHGVDSGAIMLLLPENIDNLIEEYEYFKRLQIGVQMNVVYKAIDNAGAVPIPVDGLIEGVCEFFDYWIMDTNKPAQSRLFETYLNRLLNRGDSFCADQDCVGKWFGVHPDGTLMPCGNDWQEDMTFGNIHDYSSVEEIMEHPNFVRFKSETRELLEACKDCPFFYACHGGCYAIAYNNNGNCKKPDKETCLATQNIFSHIFNRIKDINIYTDGYKYNPYFSKTLYAAGYRSLPLIKEALASET